MFSDVRSEILPRLEQVLLLDLPLSHQKSVEQLMWKSAFYQVIEVFRQELAEFDDERVRQQLLSVIDSVNSHFSLAPHSSAHIPSPTHSFIPGLKPSFFFFRIHYMDSPDCLLLFLSISVFYFWFFCFYTF